jgi:hypothetical protein
MFLAVMETRPGLNFCVISPSQYVFGAIDGHYPHSRTHVKRQDFELHFYCLLTIKRKIHLFIKHI